MARLAARAGALPGHRATGRVADGAAKPFDCAAEPGLFPHHVGATAAAPHAAPGVVPGLLRGVAACVLGAVFRAAVALWLLDDRGSAGAGCGGGRRVVAGGAADGALRLPAGGVGAGGAARLPVDAAAALSPSGGVPAGLQASQARIVVGAQRPPARAIDGGRPGSLLGLGRTGLVATEGNLGWQSENPSPQPPPRNGEGEKKRCVWLAPPLLAGEGVGGRGSRSADRRRARCRPATQG